MFKHIGYRSMREMQGSYPPKYYGVAWYETCGFRVYLLPIPFNKIAGWARALWYWLMIPVTSHVERAYDRGHQIGYAAGNDSGYKAGFKNGGEAELQKLSEHIALFKSGL